MSDSQSSYPKAKGHGVLFYCYECEVDRIKLDDGGYQRPKCKGIAKFDINKVIRESGGWLDE